MDKIEDKRVRKINWKAHHQNIILKQIKVKGEKIDIFCEKFIIFNNGFSFNSQKVVQ